MSVPSLPFPASTLLKLVTDDCAYCSSSFHQASSSKFSTPKCYFLTPCFLCTHHQDPLFIVPLLSYSVLLFLLRSSFPLDGNVFFWSSLARRWEERKEQAERVRGHTFIFTESQEAAGDLRWS